MKLEFNMDILKKAIATYGKTPQKIMLFEEMAELQKEVCKEIRGSDNYSAITEEMADVYIMLEQLSLMFNIHIHEIQKVMDSKIKRLDERLAEVDQKTTTEVKQPKKRSKDPIMKRFMLGGVDVYCKSNQDVHDLSYLCGGIEFEKESFNNDIICYCSRNTDVIDRVCSIDFNEFMELHKEDQMMKGRKY